MDTQRVEILHACNGEAVVVGVTNNLELYLLPTLQTLLNEHLGCEGECTLCNLLEHLILHVKIAAEPRNANANENELPGIGGAVNFICRELNDIFGGKEPSDEWRKKVASLVKDSFDDYIMVLKYLLSVIEKNPIYKAAITTESLCVGYDGKVVRSVLNALLDNDD